MLSMTWWDSALTYKWYIAGAIALIVLIAIIVKIVKKKKKGKQHEHNFIPKSHFVIKDDDGKDNPRLLKVCTTCGVAIHVPIYTLKKLKEKEEKEYYEQNHKEA